jgi:hypothetical protein
MTARTTDDPFTLLSDADLAQMIDRAYFASARASREYQVEPRTSTIKRILFDASNEAFAYYQRLTAERMRRITSDD